MNRLFLLASLVFALSSLVEAREPTNFEAYCLNTMFHLETQLASHLSRDYHIVDTHPSPIGPKLVRGEYIRDCWVSRKDKVVARIVLFERSQVNNSSLLFDAAYSKVQLETERDGEKVVLGIAVLGKDESLVRKLTHFINGIDFRKLRTGTQAGNLARTTQK